MNVTEASTIDSLNITNATTINGGLLVTGATTFTDNVTIPNLDVSGAISINDIQYDGDLVVSQGLNVQGAATINSLNTLTTLTISPATTTTNALIVNGNTNLFGNLNLQGSTANILNTCNFNGPVNFTDQIRMGTLNVNELNAANQLTCSGSSTLNILNVLSSASITTLSVSRDLNVTGTIYQGGVAFSGSQWVTNGTNIYFDVGNVGIGVASPEYALDVNGSLRASGASTFNANIYTNNLTVEDSITLDGNIILGVNSSIVFKDSGETFQASQWDNNDTGIYYSIGNVNIGTAENTSYKLNVNGVANFSDIDVTSNANISKLNVISSSTLSGTLQVNAPTTVSSELNVGSNNTSTASLNVFGNTSIFEIHQSIVICL